MAAAAAAAVIVATETAETGVSFLKLFTLFDLSKNDSGLSRKQADDKSL